jgi:hypothetical protein
MTARDPQRVIAVTAAVRYESKAMGAAARRGEPAWTGKVRDAGASGAAIYSNTYDAISASEGHRVRVAPRRPPIGRMLVWMAPIVAIVVAVVAALYGRPPRPVQERAKAPPSIAANRDNAFRSVPAARGPEVIGTTPTRPKRRLHVGDVADFAIAASGLELRYGWTVDGKVAGTGPRWTFIPTPDQVGRRRVEVTVSDRQGSVRHAWMVRVDGARPPRIIGAEPAEGVVQLAPGNDLKLRLEAESATGTEQLKTTWTVDGKPAGEGETFSLRPTKPGRVVVGAQVQSDLGVSSRREWRVAVTKPEPPKMVVSMPLPPPPPVETAAIKPAPPAAETTVREVPAMTPPATIALATPPPSEHVAPPEPPRVVPQPERAPEPPRAAAPVERAPAPEARTPEPPRAVTEPEAPRTVTPPEPPRLATHVEPPSPVAPPAARPPAVAIPTPPPPPSGAPATADVQRWLQRYAMAWRAHDVETLRSMGQVTSQDEVNALRNYFAQVRDLDVEINLVAVRSEGERTVIRFTRRDRFRDPAGRLVEKESPQLEKHVVRTSDGLRIVRPQG